MHNKNNGKIITYGINGSLLFEDDDKPGYISDIIIGSDSNFNDYAIYINEDESLLTFRKLPGLEKKSITIQKKPTVLTMFDNKKMLIVGDQTGQFTLYWDLRSSLMIK